MQESYLTKNKIEIRYSDIKGYGLYAKVKILKINFL